MPGYHTSPCPLVLPILLGLVMAGCGSDQSRLFDATSTPKPDEVQQQIRSEIADLAKGKDPHDDDGVFRHDEAVSKLTARGSGIEPQMIDALRVNPDWNVRLGSLEVLQSIGTKSCVEHVIAALLDDQPIISLHANSTLVALTHHEVLPAAGHPPVDGLPPVPQRDPKELGMDAELNIWTTYELEHRQALHDVWAAWWKANAAKVRVD